MAPLIRFNPISNSVLLNLYFNFISSYPIDSVISLSDTAATPKDERAGNNESNKIIMIIKRNSIVLVRSPELLVRNQSAEEMNTKYGQWWLIGTLTYCVDKNKRAIKRHWKQLLKTFPWFCLFNFYGWKVFCSDQCGIVL